MPNCRYKSHMQSRTSSPCPWQTVLINLLWKFANSFQTCLHPIPRNLWILSYLGKGTLDHLDQADIKCYEMYPYGKNTEGQQAWFQTGESNRWRRQTMEGLIHTPKHNWSVWAWNRFPLELLEQCCPPKILTSNVCLWYISFKSLSLQSFVTTATGNWQNHHLLSFLTRRRTQNRSQLRASGNTNLFSGEE